MNADATEIRNMMKKNCLWVDVFGYLDRKIRQGHWYIYN